MWKTAKVISCQFKGFVLAVFHKDVAIVLPGSMAEIEQTRVGMNTGTMIYNKEVYIDDLPRPQVLGQG